MSPGKEEALFHLRMATKILEKEERAKNSGEGYQILEAADLVIEGRFTDFNDALEFVKSH